MKLIIFFLFTTFIFSNEKGVCLIWVEGDGQSLQECKESNVRECSKNKKSISNMQTTFSNYKGKIFKSSSDDQNVIEFLENKDKTHCEKLFVSSARDYENTMSDNWGYFVYSDLIKVGEKAFVYGNKIILREKPSTKSKKLNTLDNNLEIKILDKSKEKEKLPKSSKAAFWFKIKISEQVGWVYGQFIHPDPNSKESLGL